MHRDGNGTLNFKEFALVMTNGEFDLFAEEINQAELEARENLDVKIIEKRKRLKEEKDMKDAETRKVIVHNLRCAWGYDDEERKELEEQALTHPILARYKMLALRAEQLCRHRYFVSGMTLVICCAGILVGISTDLNIPGEVKPHPILRLLDSIILSIFAFEIVVKVISEGTKPLSYFKDPWNRFDFTVVALCGLFTIPGFPNVGNILSMLRLLRLLRVLKLVKTVPELRILIEALLGGFKSVTFVMIILFIVYFMYANVGMLLFSANDPAHFGNLQNSLISLLRIATFDAWSDIL